MQPQISTVVKQINEQEIEDKEFTVVANDEATLVINNISKELSKLPIIKEIVLTVTEKRKFITDWGNSGSGGDNTSDETGTNGAAGTLLNRVIHSGVAAAYGLNKTVGGKVLVGERGREMYVDPYTGIWQTVGDYGAEFVNVRKGGIIFNHLQTESLLKNGYTPNRGTALVSGNAYAGGAGGSGINPLLSPNYVTTTKTTTTTETTTSGSTSGSSSSSSSGTNGNNNYYNYFEAMLKDRENAQEKYETELEKLQEQLENALENNDIELYDSLMANYSSLSQEYRDYLHSSAEEIRKVGEEQIYPIIYKFAPELEGQTVDDWSEETLLDIQKRVDDKLIELENSGI